MTEAVGVSRVARKEAAHAPVDERIAAGGGLEEGRGQGDGRRRCPSLRHPTCERLPQHVVKAHRLLYHSTLGLRVIQKKKVTMRMKRSRPHISYLNRRK